MNILPILAIICINGNLMTSLVCGVGVMYVVTM